MVAIYCKAHLILRETSNDFASAACLFFVGTFTINWELVEKPLVKAVCSQWLHWLHQARVWFEEVVNPSWSWPFSGQKHTKGRAQSDFCWIWLPLNPDDPSKAAAMIWNYPKWRPCFSRKTKIFNSFSPIPTSVAVAQTSLPVCLLPAKVWTAQVEVLGSDSLLLPAWNTSS